MSARDLLLTTNPGIEDVVVTEIGERAATAGVSLLEAAPDPDRRGAVRARLEANDAQLDALIAGMRSIHHALRPLASFTLDPDDPVGDARRRAAALRIEELTPGRTFRATGHRRGTHDFNSEDLARAVGAGVLERHDVGVSMKGFDVEIRAEVRDTRCDLSVQRTRKALSVRGARPYRARAALKANVGYAMLRLTLDGQPAPRRLLDPFCGSGTLLLEAADRYPDAALVGVELFEKPAVGARANLAAQGLADRAVVQRADSRQLRALFPEDEGGFDALITNPPFGVRLGSGLDFDALFESLLAGAASLLRGGGRLGALIWHRDVFNRVLRRQPALRIVHVRVIDTGGLHPGLFVLERLPRT